MTAEQYINIDAMGFIWKAKTNLVKVLDQFINGKGRLTIKVFGLFKVGDFQGVETDQGEALRFLSESMLLTTYLKIKKKLRNLIAYLQ